MSDEEQYGPDVSAGIAMDDLEKSGLYGGRLDGDPVVIVKVGDRLCAFSGTCTHMGAPLKDGIVTDGTLRCPWHHARFSLETGEAVAAPAFKPLSLFKVRKNDGRVFVERDHTSAKRPISGEPMGKVLIVGGGAAGFACAELLTRAGHGESVTVISSDTDKPYDRTQCSKQYLSGESSREDCLLEGAEPSNGKTAAIMTGEKVVALDLIAKEVELDGGKRLPFDSLVLATGSEPKRPDIPGFDRPNVYMLRTLRDADVLIKVASEGKRAVVVGASFIGLEVAASLRQRKVEINVVVPDDVPLKKVFGPEIGRMIRDVHKKKGVRFHLGRKAKDFDGRTLTLDDGTALEADFVVLGTGVAPRCELAQKAGLIVASEDEGGGVMVDSRLETSMPGVYAVGDIARYPDIYANQSLRIEHWVHAQRQGQHVARILMGQESDYSDLPFFWTLHFDTGVDYLGRANKPTVVNSAGSVKDQNFVLIHRDDDGAEAVVTCGRERQTLQIEAAWQQTGQAPTKI